MKKIFTVFILISLFSFQLSCEKKGQTAPSSTENLNGKIGKNDYEQIITPNNELGFKLLAEIAEDDETNIFISPTSLFFALSMLYNGAEHKTKEEIATALQTSGITVDDLNRANASLINKLSKDTEHIQLHIANSLWLSNQFTAQEMFVQNNRDYFSAEVKEIDVFDPASSDLINHWVEDQTNGKIADIVEPPLNSDLIAILINAIYFNGTWTYEFNKTENQPFYLADGSEKEVPFMKLDEELFYMENELFQAVSLPYGQGEMSIHVFLPHETSSLIDFQKQLTPENWTTWKKQFQQKEGTVLLPKFKLEYDIKLNETLENLGMKTAFDKGADFSKVIEETDPVWISEVKQKTFIDVNEEGTEAAAVTSIELMTESAIIEEKFFIDVNRPFFITITDEDTEAILFMGLIVNPAQSVD